MPALAELPRLDPLSLPAPGWDERFLAAVGSAIDQTVIRAVQAVVEAVLAPAPGDLESLRASAAPFLEAPLQDEPARFFDFGSSAPTAESERDRMLRALPSGAAWKRTLTADYRPFGAPAEAAPSRLRMPIEHWVHDRQPPRATVLALHGFGMGRPRIDARALFAAQWFRRGMDVALLTLPDHGVRAPAGARFPGGRFAEPHVGRVNEAVRQAVYEVRSAVNWLRRRTRSAVGVVGLSLGGYVSALAAGLSADLDFVVPIVPPVCMGDLAWRFFERGKFGNFGKLDRAGAAAFSRHELRSAFRVHSPLAHAPRIDRSRVMIVAGRGDRIVPAEHPHALWRHWGEPAIHWFGGSHLAPFGRGAIVEAVCAHLRRLDVL